jgi:Na+/proline symporter
VFGAGDPVFEPRAANEPIWPARSCGRLIALLVLIVAGVAGAAYWQRNTLNLLVASFRTDSQMDMWDLAIPIFAYGVIAFTFAYVFLRWWFGNRS